MADGLKFSKKEIQYILESLPDDAELTFEQDNMGLIIDNLNKHVRHIRSYIKSGSSTFSDDYWREMYKDLLELQHKVMRWKDENTTNT